jgi:hypothetical protein
MDSGVQGEGEGVAGGLWEPVAPVHVSKPTIRDQILRYTIPLTLLLAAAALFLPTG